MSLTVTLRFPPEVEKMLQADQGDLNLAVTEAFALELFRQGRLSHFELSKVLGLNRFETDGYLKRHNVFEGSLTMADLEADYRTLTEVLDKAR